LVAVLPPLPCLPPLPVPPPAAVAPPEAEPPAAFSPEEEPFPVLDDEHAQNDTATQIAAEATTDL
jgi:hypothetical protein